MYGKYWWSFLIRGILATLFGVVAIVIPGLTLRDEVEGEWLLGLGGIFSILFSFILFINPGVGAVAMVWVIGVYAILFGISMRFLGIRPRKRQVVINL